jgi:hypothetical protein
MGRRRATADLDQPTRSVNFDGGARMSAPAPETHEETLARTSATGEADVGRRTMSTPMRAAHLSYAVVRMPDLGSADLVSSLSMHG